MSLRKITRQEPKTILIFCAAIFAIFCSAVQGQDDVIKKLTREEAEMELETDLTAIDMEYRERIATAKSRLVERLNVLKSEATKSDNLDEAVSLRNRIEELTAELPQALPNNSKSSDTAGKNKLVELLSQSKWDVTNTGWRDWTDGWIYFSPNGTVNSFKNKHLPPEKSNGRWAVIDPWTIVFVSNLTSHVHLIRFNEKRDSFECFHMGVPKPNGTQEWKSIKRTPIVQLKK
jgi:hypothetical protein